MKGKQVIAGAKTALSPSGIVLMIAFFAFGALVRSVDFPLSVGVGLTLFTFAIPSQIVLVDELSRGASIFTAVIATTLTAVRLFPLTMSLMPTLREPSTPKWQQYGLSHFNAITVWIQSMNSLPALERADRISFYLGHCCMMMCLTVGTTILGYYSAQHLSLTYLAGALMITPIYFFLSLFAGSKTFCDRLAFLFGTLFAIPMMIFFPDLAILGAGFLGGTLAYVLGRAKSKVSDE